MYDRYRQKDAFYFARFLVLALLLHLAVLPLFQPAPAEFVPSVEEPTIVEIMDLSKDSKRIDEAPGAKRQAVMKQEEKEKVEKEEKAEEKEEKEERPKGQVVDIAPTKDDTPPKDAKFLSEYNTNTSKQTKSRYQDKNYTNPLSRPSVPLREEDVQRTGEGKSLELALLGKDVKESEGRQPEKEAARFEIPDVRKSEALQLEYGQNGEIANRLFSEELRGNSSRFAMETPEEAEGEEKKEEAGTKGEKKLAMLLPDAITLSRVAGSPSNDYLDEIEEGEETLLNSKAFKYATYFNRVKKGVNQHWHPAEEYMKRDPTGTIYGYRDRLTVLDITLNADGTLKKVDVTQPCGIDFLDREAVSSFERAQPFPNPPKGLVDQDSQIKFSFGFYFEISSSPVFHIFREQRY